MQTYRVNDGVENYYVAAKDWYAAADAIFAYEDYDWSGYTGGGRYAVWLQDENGNDVGAPETGELDDFRG